MQRIKRCFFVSGESVADTRQPFFRARGKKPDSPFRPTPEIKRSTRQQIDLFVSVHTNLYFITTETFIGKTLFFCTNSALRHMPYNGFEKYFIRETESRLASGYQSTEKMPRRSFPKAPFSADAYHPNCPFIGQAKAGLLTRPRRNAFPVPQDQWQKECRSNTPGHPKRRPQAGRSPRIVGQDSQQRELSQTFTAFPFNLTGRNPS